MSNVNYMDGVPVKIAEKFKPPPPIYNLPQSVLNKINLENDFYWKCPSFSCELQLEKKALSKIEQWKRIRQRNKEQRKERILKREHLRKQEYEEKQKILLNNVSYPSTDDLSSEEEEENDEQCTQSKENGMTKSGSKATSPQTCFQQTVNSFDNILQPTVLAFTSSSTAYNSNASISKSSVETKVSNSFNYKDFEEDTSSPFDNIELKTINDLDVLAQVLHNSQIKSPADEMLNNGNMNELGDISEKNRFVCLPEQEELNVENIPKHNSNLPRFQNDLKSVRGNPSSFRDHNLILENKFRADLLHSSLNDGYNNQSNDCNASEESANHQLNKDNQSLLDDQLKSKSVPDILRELRDEIKKSEIRRYRNCSFNMEYSSKPSDVCLAIESGDECRNTDVFSQLDSKSKELVRQISAMGFPLKRVARIVQLLGADDKKVVEHLIPLSELADLGFEETKISDALIRNENNKNKALDDLIS